MVCRVVNRAVNRNLFKVRPESVTLGIWVGENTGLQDAIVGKLYAWYERPRAEGGLLNLGMEVNGVTVQNQFRNLDQGIVTMGPDLSDVCYIVSVGISILFWHDLDIYCPSGRLSRCNMVE